MLTIPNRLAVIRTQFMIDDDTMMPPLYRFRVGMVGGKYQWLIMGTYGPKWWNEMRSPCPVQHLSAALDGCILTDYLPLSTTGEITVSGIVSTY